MFYTTKTFLKSFPRCQVIEELQWRVMTLIYVDPIQIWMKSKKISNDQELIQSDPTSCPQNQKGNN